MSTPDAQEPSPEESIAEEAATLSLAARIWHQIGFWGGPLAAALFIAGPYLAAPGGSTSWAIDPAHPELNAMAAVAAWMAIWWLTEAVPLAATSVLPLALFPLFGIMKPKDVAAVYGDTNIFLYLGGFLVALAIERSGVHKRMALAVVAAMGRRPELLVGGFMLATALLSMWLSNTATTLMMLPIAIGVLVQMDQLQTAASRNRNLGVTLMLGLAYSASIGGIATFIGTPTNVFIRGYMEENLPGSQISFLGWMTLGVPFAATMLLCTWALLVYVLFPLRHIRFHGDLNVIAEERARLGRMRPAEWRAIIIFAVTALLWMTRVPIGGLGPQPGLDPTSSLWARIQVEGLGWSQIPGIRWADDSSVAMLMAVICFMMPIGVGRERLLTWEAAKAVPWDILLLFGGGLALAAGLRVTALDAYLGGRLANSLAGWSETGMVAMTAFGMTFFTELTSNQACIQMMAPLLTKVATAPGVSIDPKILLITATISASCAFMLPVATPPNAIVYGSGRVRMRDMVFAGVGLNLIGVALVTIFVLLIRL